MHSRAGVCCRPDIFLHRRLLRLSHQEGKQGLSGYQIRVLADSTQVADSTQENKGPGRVLSDSAQINEGLALLDSTQWGRCSLARNEQHSWQAPKLRHFSPRDLWMTCHHGRPSPTIYVHSPGDNPAENGFTSNSDFPPGSDPGRLLHCHAFLC